MVISSKGNRILILGASSDMAIAFIKLLFHKWNSSHFYLLARNTDTINNLIAEGKLFGHTVEVKAYDLLQPTEVFFTEINYLVVYAGWLPPDNSQPELSMQVNFTAIKSFVEKFISNNTASLKQIILTGSMAGVRVRPKNRSYGQAKAALHQYAKKLQQQWKKQFTVTLVIPGLVKTKMIAYHKTPALLTISVEVIAEKYWHWMHTQPQVVYSQRIWQFIAFGLRNIPDFLIRNTKK